MVSYPNKFYRGVVKPKENNPHPKFRFILVDTIRELKDIDGTYYTDSFEFYQDFLFHDHSYGDIFYGVYASYHIDSPKSALKITETYNLKEAINIAQEIMDNSIEECKLDFES